MHLPMPSYLLLIALTVALLDLHDTVKGDEETEEHPSEPDCESKCGLPKVRPNCGNRIVGGSPARKCSWCWQASVQKKGNNGYFHTCGGSIINSRYGYGGAENFQVSLGDFDRTESKTTSKRLLLPVERIVIHSDYIGQPDYWRNDIALLKVNTDIKFTKCICPVCLPHSDYTVDLNNCYATGWGRIGTDGPPSMTLQQVTMNNYNHGVCSQPAWYGTMITDNMICFGHDVGGMGTCQGDSGGPLVCTGRDNMQWYLYGLTSWAKGGCASPKHPTIFTNIPRYIAWIYEMMELHNEEEYFWC